METTDVKMGRGNSSWTGNYDDGDVKTITLCVTEDCNLTCKYCYMTGKNHKKKMNFQIAKKAIDFIFDNPGKFSEKSVIWDFIGGEPFLEVELIDKICDYLKMKMFTLRPSWFDSYRFSFSSNGLLYSTEKVQQYIEKNKLHLSIGISIDGNKDKHDLQRVFPNGEGSYDKVMKNVELWKTQFQGSSTKATFSSDDLPLLKDSIISLWENGIEDVSANVVFEDVWKENDDKILESQLDALGDYILENNLWNKYRVRFFDPFIGNPLNNDIKKHNFCGSGKMLAIDCDGNFYPCIRFLDFSLSNRKGRCIGNADDGINENKLRAFNCLTLEDQSDQECLGCEVATGCALCTGFNYDETGSIFKRSTSICKMHKATVRANKRFWRKYEEVTGNISPRRQYEKDDNYRYIQIMISDNIVPHCDYRNIYRNNEIMDEDTIKRAMEFSINNGYEIVFLGEPPKSIEIKNPSVIYITGEDDKKQRSSEQYIDIYDNEVKCSAENIKNCVLLINKDNIKNLSTLIEKLLKNKERINLVLEGTDKWTEEEINEYGNELDIITELIVEECKKNNYVEVNVLTDRLNSYKHCNCTNGSKTITLAPNGKFYICPAFYFNNPGDSIGNLDRGIINENESLMHGEKSSLCKQCDAYQCKICKFMNKKLTEEYVAPSKIQCLISNYERNKSKELQKKLIKSGLEVSNKIMGDINSLDPLENFLLSNN
ncbi:radical SAM peptide maturase, CXXX-repeat target family [uncultured Clostridium sp.]|uniref:radical SAM peptide maturase, CXXX-repeat target family n=1 Tax=uncultured Clostridium sp. TaxID=59620 RepID=UPI0032168998